LREHRERQNAQDWLCVTYQALPANEANVIHTLIPAMYLEFWSWKKICDIVFQKGQIHFAGFAFLLFYGFYDICNQWRIVQYSNS